MNAQLYTGILRHTRTVGADHDFTYHLHLYALDLAELEQLGRQSWWFGHNQVRPVALHDRDYLYPGDAPLTAKVERALTEVGIDRAATRVVLVTALRQWHYAFNPVSFFFCYTDGGNLLAVLAQVNNTFGETHLYPLRPEEDDQTFRIDKAFHVSPFFPRTGAYRFHLTPPGEATLDLTIEFFRDNRLALLASLHDAMNQVADLARL